MGAFIYREFYGPGPVMINMEIYEMDEVWISIFHNYLMRKEGLHNTLLRFPQQFIQDREHFIFIDKELADWAGKETKVQEHGRWMSDIISVDIYNDKDSSEHSLIPKTEGKNLGNRES
jgi:hypothetical protein